MWDRQASEAVGREALAIIRTNMARRVDATGRPYPPGQDNVESGELANSFVVDASDGGAAVVNTVEHAAPRNARVPFHGVPPRDERRLHAAVEQQLARLERGM